MFRTGLAIAALFSCTAPLAAQSSEPAAIARRAELIGTEQFVFHSAVLKRDLLIQVTPPYNAEDRPLPVVYLTDAELSAWAGVLARMGSATGETEPAFFVAIGYPELDEGKWFQQRARDLLHVEDFDFAAVNPAFSGMKSGGGADFEKFLIEELKPEIERRYRVDPARSVLEGYSLGGLFATRVLARHPEAFGTFLIGSPSEDIDTTLVADIVDAKIPSGTRIFMGVGGAENPRSVAHSLAIAEALRKNPSGLDVEGVWIGQGLGHIEFIPEFMTRAIKFALRSQAN